MSILTKNLRAWYTGGADLESAFRFLKFRPWNPFLGKFGEEKSKLSFFLENWHKLYLENADSYSDISFLNFQPKIHFFGKFGPKKAKLSVLPENWHPWYLEDAHSYSDISFLNCQPKTRFWANLGQKMPKISDLPGIDAHCISRMDILIPTLVFWISKPKPTFRQSYTYEVKLPVSSDATTQRISRLLICFIWKLEKISKKFCKCW